jgi:hypothetical protein
MSAGAGAIKALFDTNLSHLKFDVKLAKKINDFQTSFVNKNEEHLAFFGGNLTGVHTVRFTTQDKDRWFTDVLECDDVYLEEQLLKIPIINPNFHVSTNIFNHICMWLIHSFKNSNLINDKIKERAIIDCGLILYYGYITSLLFRYYRFPVDKSLAEATYAQLSKKFALKRHGSWYKTLEARVQDMVDPHGLHGKTLSNFTDDVAIIYMINDTQGRIRDMMKNIIGELMKVKAQGSRIKSSSSLMDFNGEESLKDSTRNLSRYVLYLNSVVIDKNSFIKQELVDIVVKIMHTMSPRLFVETLTWCSVNSKHLASKDVDILIDETLTHAFGYLTNNRTVFNETSNLPDLITRLRGIYMSSKSSDLNLLKIRELSQNIVKKATTTKNENMVSSLKTGLLLYVVIRALTMNYYSK